MPDIGTTLREARMRQRIDISEVESATKIRAKYLRALESEEWDLLPGPTFVKSFLRTYADALGLDGKLLIEEYKLRHERLSDVDLQPIVPPGGTARRPGRGGRERTRRPRPAIPRRWAILGLVAVLLVALYLVGTGGGGHDGPGRVGTGASAPAPSANAAPSSGTGTGGGTTSTPSPPRAARLSVVATGQVYVCLKAAGNRTLANGVILTGGARLGPFRSSHFRMRLGNAEARLVVDGRSRALAPVANGAGYEVTPGGVRRLPRASWPSCAT
jgi:hypothetical protein